MRKLYIIGIGAGNPEHVTVQAITALNKVDVFFVMNKGEATNDLLRLRKDICERYITKERSYRTVEAVDPRRDPAVPSYPQRVEQWHQERAILYEQMMAGELGEDSCGAFLVWGDPSLYDSTLRIVDRIIARGVVRFDYEIIPGITSVQVLTAQHKIPLNGIGESICITTGRHLAAGLPHGMENVVVMLDSNCSFKTLQERNETSLSDIEIFWGAYLGTGKEILLSGKLMDIADEIERVRQEARDRNGWIMDTYLLRKLPKNLFKN